MAEPLTPQIGAARQGRVRRATPADAEAITALVNAVGAEGRWVLRERATWTLDEERTTLAAASGSESAFFVGEVDGKVVGLLNIQRGRFPKNAHTAEFGVSCLPGYRRAGLGTALIGAAIDWAVSVGVRKLSLEVFEDNAPAIALYRKLGFSEEARLLGEFIIDGRSVDGLRMARWLSDAPSGND